MDNIKEVMELLDNEEKREIQLYLHSKYDLIQDRFKTCLNAAFSLTAREYKMCLNDVEFSFLAFNYLFLKNTVVFLDSNRQVEFNELSRLVHGKAKFYNRFLTHYLKPV